MTGRERLRVHVLGRFRILSDVAAFSLPPRLRKPQELLQALIAFGSSEVSVGTLIDALWPDSEGDAAYHALESALYRLRLLLGARNTVCLLGGKVSLNRDQLTIDMWDLESEMLHIHNPVAGGSEEVFRLRSLYKGPFLEHEPEKSWVLKVREEIRDRLLSVVRETAAAYEQALRWEDAVHLYQFGIEVDALNEGLYRNLMHCHQELGNHSEALQVYRRCRERLTRVLGVPPNAKTVALYHRVRERAVSMYG
jgi:DNA-binding SARP family transcriptional activator